MRSTRIQCQWAPNVGARWQWTRQGKGARDHIEWYFVDIMRHARAHFIMESHHVGYTITILIRHNGLPTFLPIARKNRTKAATWFFSGERGRTMNKPPPSQSGNNFSFKARSITNGTCHFSSSRSTNVTTNKLYYACQRILTYPTTRSCQTKKDQAPPRVTQKTSVRVTSSYALDRRAFAFEPETTCSNGYILNRQRSEFA